MTSNELQLGHVIDFRTGLELVWESGKESSGEYSLIKVPNNIPFKLAYKKPALAIDVKLAPTKDLFYWQVEGTLDPDTIANLGMRVSQPRRGNKPPIVTEVDLKQLREYGEVLLSDPNSKAPFGVKINVPIQNISGFLYRVWRPVACTKRFPGFVPNYHLGRPDMDYRILPQKIISGDNPGRNVTLTVEKIR